jgi:hypothetical protein
MLNTLGKTGKGGTKFITVGAVIKMERKFWKGRMNTVGLD